MSPDIARCPLGAKSPPAEPLHYIYPAFEKWGGLSVCLLSKATVSHRTCITDRSICRGNSEAASLSLRIVKLSKAKTPDGNNKKPHTHTHTHTHTHGGEGEREREYPLECFCPLCRKGSLSPVGNQTQACLRSLKVVSGSLLNQ